MTNVDRGLLLNLTAVTHEPWIAAMRVDRPHFLCRLIFGISAYLCLAAAVCAAASYPPATGLNSSALDGTIALRRNADGTTNAHVTVEIGNAPWTVTSTSQQVDDDSLDLLIVFRIDGGFLGQTYTNDINLGVLPSTVTRVRFLTQTSPTKPIVLQAEAPLGDQCLTFGSTLPTSASAYETMQIPVALTSAASPARVLRIVAAGSSIDIYVDTKLATDVCPRGSAPLVQALDVAVSGRAAGLYTIRLLHYTGKVAAAAPLRVAEKGVQISVRSLEFRARGSYFLTASSVDVTALLGLTGAAQEQLWASADDGFSAWAATGDAPASAAAVCRFFNAQASTHFYSARPEDCVALRARSDWTDEGTAFRILLPQSGACGDGTVPVYRLFSPSLANHRYTTSTSSYLTMLSVGWTGEGIAFCGPAA